MLKYLSLSRNAAVTCTKADDIGETETADTEFNGEMNAKVLKEKSLQCYMLTALCVVSNAQER